MIISSFIGISISNFYFIFMIRLRDVSVTQGIIHHTDTMHMMLCSPAGARAIRKLKNHPKATILQLLPPTGKQREKSPAIRIGVV